ncbi:hypothetical protein [Pseudoalteromonas luteoviolacea]|uniref:Uncharacterized protein n=1 Tax=Pseudoalteromonas luteoviolacea NCIMB 1942 TaxID=1365253 RepID=A0A161Y0G1_9GAMM|nr:hypothetical protein [Pseudoalteromonas luteoviolacea]KZN49221.1 hypothetical protein N482_06690 [Pseudoalteromonas luteoviolacea NCIMB 1942]
MNQVKFVFCLILFSCIITLVWWLANATIKPLESEPLQNSDSAKPESTQLFTPAATNEISIQQKRLPTLNTKLAVASQPSTKLTSQENMYIPPITHAAKAGSAPRYRGDLSDHENYNDFLLEQEQTIKKDYIAAVDKKVERLSQLLQKGVNVGLPQSQLTEAREKIAALKEMKAHLEKELKAQR